MKVSVVVPTYADERYNDLTACVQDALDQTYDDVEVVIIVDGNESVYERAMEEFGDNEDVVIFCNHENRGPLSRGNMGVIQASGDIVALTDDDASLSADWIETLVDTYERHDAIAVGGRVDPEWVAGEPEFLPEEFYWLIGATHRGFGEKEREVRNTFGANLSFRRDIFLKLGGIKLSGLSNSKIQGRETEFCARMAETYGRGVVYNPEAVVAHKIYEYRTEKGWLVRRAFWQGYSKRGLQQFLPESVEAESAYLRKLLFEFTPRRIRGIARSPTRTNVSQIVWLFVLLAAVGFGYVAGLIRWR